MGSLVCNLLGHIVHQLFIGAEGLVLTNTFKLKCSIVKERQNAETLIFELISALFCLLEALLRIKEL